MQVLTKIKNPTIVETPGQYTHQSMKAYKSLCAYEYVISGHIQPVLFHPITEESEICFLKTKVIPSQRVRDTDHQLWACISKDGSVYCAHCMCMAG